jgi:hypothetical protein
MSTTCQAKARRRQAANNYAHLPPRLRPNFKKRSAEASAARLQKLIATERRIAQGGKGKKA